MPPKSHAALGASKAYRWMACPGSVRMEEGQPDIPSEHALEGTAAHAVAESLLRGETAALGGTIGGVTVTEELLDAVQVYVDFVEASSIPGAHRYIEQQFDLAPLGPPAPMYGTSDCVVWRPEEGHLHVIDYKHGKGVLVEVEENPQLMYYALGAVVMMRVKPSIVTVTVVQPRAEHPEGPVRSWTFDWETLRTFKAKLFEAARATLDPNAPLVPGDHCRFCKAQAVCPALKSLAETTAQEEFAVIEAEPQALVSPEALTIGELVRALEVAPVIEDWFRSVRERVQFLLECGIEVPGWKLVKRRAVRKWKDESAAAEWLEQKLGEDAYEEPKILSPAQAEKRLKKIDKEAAKAVEQFTTKESPGVTIAPESDRRPAVIAGVNEFNVLPKGD